MIRPSLKYSALAALYIAASGGSLALGQQHPNLERGFSADKVYDSVGPDSVNLFNGGLSVVIPVSESYPVNGGIAPYQLRAVYSSKVWDTEFRAVGEGGYTQAIPNRRSNAGLSWLVSFGRLIPPGDASNDTFNQWILVSSDGADHVFYDTMRPGEASTANVFFTRDSTYLRLRRIANGEGEVDFPDGTIQRFDSSHRLTEIRDRFSPSNAISIAYAGNGLSWTITDTTTARTHTVVLQSVMSDGALVKVIDYIDVAAPNGVARYDFSYLQRSIPRSGDDFVCLDNDPVTSPTVEVPLLMSISMPEGLSYQFVYNEADGDSTCKSGTLQIMTVPTKGKLEWDYGRYLLPAAGCIHAAGAPDQYESRSTGVVARVMRDASNTEIGRWTYTPTVEYPGGSTIDCSGLEAPPGEVVRQEVVTPTGDKLKYYFSAWPNPQTSPNGFDRGEHSLPLTRKVSTSSPLPSRFLSAETFGCNDQHLNCGTVLKRQEYVRYEGDGTCAPTDFFSDCLRRNRRLSAHLTLFADDASKFKDVAFSAWDNFGHYEQTNFTANFGGGGDSRSTTVDFEPQASTSIPWLLNTIRDIRTTEGGSTARRQFVFNLTNGFLERVRTLKTGITPGTTDHIVRFLPEVEGNPASEEYFGGDGQGQQVSAAEDLRTLGLPVNAVYKIDHDWTDGSPTAKPCAIPWKSRYLSGGVSVGFDSLDQVIQCSTGLPTTTRDVAGLQTTYEYDQLGRIRFIKPQSSHGAWTELQYTNASGATLAKMNAFSKQNGGSHAVLAENVVEYDAFGRVRTEQRRMPAGGLVARTATYNAQGWLTNLTEAGLLGEGTSYLDFDPFGRPGKIRPADSVSGHHDVLLLYQGDRQVTRRVSVGVAWTGAAVQEGLRDTIETYDAQGRLASVTEPAGPSGGNVTTTYIYDVGSRLTQATVGAQARNFFYDNLGLLRWVNSPEKTTNVFGQGHDEDFPSYDARGHLLQSVDGGNDLRFGYDAAERLTEIKLPTGGPNNDKLKQFAYAPTNGAGEFSKGKLRTATRHNRFTSCNVAHNAAVEETYKYGGLGGRISQRDTKLIYDNVAGESFSQGFTWTELGMPNTVVYPSCTSCSPVLPSWTLNHEYTNGWLTRVPGYTSATTPISYHDHGLVNQVTHSNFVVDTMTNDPDKMPRPRVMAADLGSAVLWNSGNYEFDGAGNVTRTGGGYYFYDSVGRIKEGKVFLGPGGAAGGFKIQRSTYDTLGNIQSMSLQVGNTTPIPRSGVDASSTTNRLNSGSYDAAGNLIAWSGQAFEYDAFNQNRRTTIGSEDWLHFYTAGGERVWSNRLGGTTVNRWTLRDLDGKLLREFVSDSSGWHVERDYIYRGNLLLAAETPQGVRHFHLDHLGTPRAVSDSSGTQVAYHVYLPYGEEASVFNQDSERMKFTGHERDLHSASEGDEVDYMHARQYSLLAGRFQSADWIGGSSKAPQSLNRYAYVHGGPLTYRDPFGLQTEPENDDIPYLGVPGETINVFGDAPRLPLWAVLFFMRGSGGGGGGGFGASDEETPTVATVTLRQQDCRPVAGGFSMDVSTINPFTSGGGGTYGLNLQGLSGRGQALYTYLTPNSQDSRGFDVGLTGTVNMALGGGSWEGDFASWNVSLGPLTMGVFGSPVQNFPAYAFAPSGWYGAQFGYSTPFFLGLGGTTTNYTQRTQPAAGTSTCR